jgi:hypothetical protein
MNNITIRNGQNYHEQVQTSNMLTQIITRYHNRPNPTSTSDVIIHHSSTASVITYYYVFSSDRNNQFPAKRIEIESNSYDQMVVSAELDFYVTVVAHSSRNQSESESANRWRRKIRNYSSEPATVTPRERNR